MYHKVKRMNLKGSRPLSQNAQRASDYRGNLWTLFPIGDIIQENGRDFDKRLKRTLNYANNLFSALTAGGLYNEKIPKNLGCCFIPYALIKCLFE